MIKPIVEGHGECRAAPVLLRRLAERMGVYDPPLLRPGRYPASQLLKKEPTGWTTGPGFDKAIGHARNEKARAILVLLDADDDCAVEIARDLQPKLMRAAGGIPQAMILAVREYEGWFLASLETLFPQAADLNRHPESVRGAKECLERLVPGYYYVETTDQARLSASMDLDLVYSRCRSFRKLVKEYHALLGSLGLAPAPLEGLFFREEDV